MSKQLISIRVSRSTKDKIDWLTEELGATQTEIISLAIDQFFNREQRQAGIKDKPPATNEIALELLRISKALMEQRSELEPDTPSHGGGGTSPLNE